MITLRWNRSVIQEIFTELPKLNDIGIVVLRLVVAGNASSSGLQLPDWGVEVRRVNVSCNLGKYSE